MEKNIELINQLIKENIKCIQIFQNGNYEHKQKEILVCKKDIEFLKNLKKKYINKC
jgi:hypothetical protein